MRPSNCVMLANLQFGFGGKLPKLVTGKSMRSWTWPKFAKRVRKQQPCLLNELAAYKMPVLISGCQRSGGTMLASVLSKHEQIVNPFWSKDAELDAALLLSGTKSHTHTTSGARYCFQTTYLNERYVEYFDHAENFRLIWLIRNPHSVVYSMVHNWSRFALNEVFAACGLHLAPETTKLRYRRFGVLGVKPVERACYAYLGKLQQCRELMKKLPPNSMMTIDYDDLVTAPHVVLPKLLDFSELAASPDIGAEISTRSLGKASRLSRKEQLSVDGLCLQSYRDAQENWTTLHAN